MADAATTTSCEEWRDVPGWEGIYRISSLGRVERLPRYVKTKNGSYRLHQGRISFGGKQSGGYKTLQMAAEGRFERRSVHELVCTLFNGPRPNSFSQVRHLDGSKDNNKASNLAWGTAKDNAEDREQHGTDPKGERAGNHRLSEADVLAIRAAYVPKYGSLTALARQYGVTPTQILHIVKRRQWAHI